MEPAVFFSHCTCQLSCAIVLSAQTSLVALLWPLSSTKCFCPQNCHSVDIYFFSAPSCEKTVGHENPRRSEMLKPVLLALTNIPWTRSLISHVWYENYTKLSGRWVNIYCIKWKRSVASLPPIGFTTVEMELNMVLF